MNILGLGTALPPHSVQQEDAEAMTTDIVCNAEVQRRMSRILHRRSGVGKRHTVIPYGTARDWAAREEEVDVRRGPTTGERMALYAEHAAPLAAAASTTALETAGVTTAEITHLVTVSCTGFEAPGVDVALIRTLGLAPTVERVNVGFMGCHGAINGLRVARAIASSQPGATVLLCAVECCSLHYRLSWDSEGVIGNALFADGSAAVVVRGDEAGANGRPWRIAATGSCLLPETTDAMGWTIGDHGFEMTLTSRVPEAIESSLLPWLDDWLNEQGCPRSAIVDWAVHPGGPRILDACQRALDLTDDDVAGSREILSRLGNMSSPTVLFLLEHLGDVDGPCLMLGFGPGLVAECALLVR